jgi:hypothetical protein
MSRHFENVREAQFYSDLDEKRSVIVIRDPATEQIVGFATMTILETTWQGERLAALFAGDTVIEPPYWGQPAWIRVWSRHAFELAATLAGETTYFLLLTSTHRSYRFLPGFFREYYPHPQRAMPMSLRERRDALVRLKFPDEFDAERGLVRLREATPVRPERYDPATSEPVDADTRYFLEANPDYRRGDFLVCFTEYSRANMTALGRRVSRPARMKQGRDDTLG